MEKFSFLEFGTIPQHIKAAHAATGLKQAEAAQVACVGLQTYRGWLADVDNVNYRKPSLGNWKFFMYELESRRLGFNSTEQLIQSAEKGLSNELVAALVIKSLKSLNPDWRDHDDKHIYDTTVNAAYKAAYHLYKDYAAFQNIVLPVVEKLAMGDGSLPKLASALHRFAQIDQSNLIKNANTRNMATEINEYMTKAMVSRDNEYLFSVAF